MSISGNRGGGMLGSEQLAFFADEVREKLAGLPRPPAMVGSATSKLLSGAVKPLTPGGTSVTSKLSKATSPASLVPPPPISA